MRALLVAALLLGVTGCTLGRTRTARVTETAEDPPRLEDEVLLDARREGDELVVAVRVRTTRREHRKRTVETRLDRWEYVLGSGSEAAEARFFLIDLLVVPDFFEAIYRVTKDDAPGRYLEGGGAAPLLALLPFVSSGDPDHLEEIDRETSVEDLGMVTLSDETRPYAGEVVLRVEDSPRMLRATTLDGVVRFDLSPLMDAAPTKIEIAARTASVRLILSP